MNSLVPVSVREPLEVDDFSTIVDVQILNANEPLYTVEDDARINLNYCCNSLITSEDEQPQVKSASNNHVKGTASVCVLDDDDDAQLSCIENGGILEEDISSEGIDDNGESLILHS